MKSQAACPAIASLLMLVACGGPDLGAVKSECSLSLEGVEYFIGSPQCFKGIPESRISGYWVVGFEYSVFYDRDGWRAYPGDQMALHLSMTQEAVRLANKQIRRGEKQAFEVEFTGRLSPALGFYGVAPSNGGVLVERFIKISEIPLPSA